MLLFFRLLVVVSFVFSIAACTGEGETGYPGVTVSVIGEKPYVEYQGEKHRGQIEITALRDVEITDIELGSAKYPKKELDKKEWVTLSSDHPGRIVLERGEKTLINFTVDVGDVDRPYGVVMKVDGDPFHRYFDLTRVHHDDMTQGISVIRVDQKETGTSNAASSSIEAEDALSETKQASEKKPKSVSKTTKTIRITAQFGYLYPNNPPVEGGVGWDDANWDPDLASAQTKNADTIKYSIYDADITLDKKFKTGYTDRNGLVDTTIQWTDCLICDAPDIYIVFETKNSAVTVESATLEINYRYKTGVRQDYTASELDFGYIVPSKNNRPVLIHSIITKANRILNNDLDEFNDSQSSGSIIDTVLRYFSPVKRVTSVDVQYPGLIASYYWSLLKEIHLQKNDVWALDATVGYRNRAGGVLLHEYGHHVLKTTAKIYYDGFTSGGYCNGYSDSDGVFGLDPIFNCGHTTWCQESGYAAWLEGYANFFEFALGRRISDEYGFPYFDPNGDILSMDNTVVEYSTDVYRMYHNYEQVKSCNEDQSVEPAITEGFIAAFMVDLVDKNFDVDSKVIMSNQTVDIIRDRDNVGIIPKLIGVVPSPYGAGISYREWSDGDNLVDRTQINYIDLINVPMRYEVRSPAEFTEKLTGALLVKKSDVWETAYNVHPFFANIMDDQAPGRVTNLRSLTHTVNTATAYPLPEFTWGEATDDASGIEGYSVTITKNWPAIPDQIKDIDNVTQYTQATVLQPGTYYFNIRALDRSNKWSSAYTSFGPFIINDSSFILDEETLLQSLTGKTIFGDYNNDGLLDLLNIDDTGVSSLRAGEVGGYSATPIPLPQSFIGDANIALIDFNNDSYDDIFVAYCDSSSKLLKNNGDDTFTEVTLNLNIGCPKLTVVDANGDGLLDVYSVQQTSVFNSNVTHQVLENTGTTFVANTVNFTDGFSLFLSRISWQDIDNNGKPELISEYTYVKGISGGFSTSRGNRVYDLTINNGVYQAVRREITAKRITGYTTPTLQLLSIPIYENISAAEIEQYPVSSWGDFDNDGDLDLVLVANTEIVLLERVGSNFIDRNGLKGSATFSSIVVAVPIAASWVDIDNDTDLDLHIVGQNNTSILINNLGVFSDATLDLWPLSTTPYGIWSDYDFDGDLDYITSTGVFANNMNTIPNKWLTVKLVGKTSNIHAVGATIKLREQTNTQTRTMDSTSSPLPVNPGLVTFGLGEIDSGYSIDVTWPSGEIESYSASIGVANQLVTLTESFFDPDMDNIDSKFDNCPDTANKQQEDFNANGIGDACEDTDQDTILDVFDNCRTVINAGQSDFDQNDIGDACDDFDGDGVLDFSDNCQAVANADQVDTDNDQIGDACDPLVDSDGDTMDDAWELQNFSALNIANLVTDADNDGYSDALEFASETDPVSYISAPGPIVIFVDKNTTNIIETGYIDSPFSTIEKAATNLKSGDTINIAAGTYEESIFISGDDVTIQGDGEVIIKLPDSNTNESVLQIVNSYHLAITDIAISGEGVSGNNALLYLGNVSDVLLSNIKIVDASTTGGQVAGIHIADNSDDITIVKSLFTGNSSDLASAIYVNTAGTVWIENCVFHANTSGSDGAAIRIDSGAITGKNSIFNQNTNDISVSSVASNSISYTMFDVESSYSAVSGNIVGFPEFVDVSSRDYHLSQCSAAIDAGDPLSDVNKEPAPNGGVINLGLYGGAIEASLTSEDEECIVPDLEEPADDSSTSAGNEGSGGSLVPGWLLFMFLILMYRSIRLSKCKRNIYNRDIS